MSEEDWEFRLPETVQEVAVEEFLEGQPRAEYWRELRLALAGRLKEAVSARDALAETDPERAAAEKRVNELREQVQALALEEIVTQFVEDSVRETLRNPRQVYLDEAEE